MNYKINLLPEELRKIKKVSPQQLAIKIVLIVSISILILSQVVYGTMLGSLKYKVSKVEDEINKLQATVVQVDTLTNANSALTKRIDTFKSLNHKEVSWADLLENIASTMNANIWLTRINIEENNSLTIEGNTDKLSNLGVFMSGLRSVKTFADVNLTSAKNSLDGVHFILTVGRGE